MVRIGLLFVFEMLALLTVSLNAFQQSLFRSPAKATGATSSALFAHHPQKKAIKKIMDKRPKKKRLSDIGRTTVNTGKCLSVFPGIPPEYRILNAENLEEAKARMQEFLANGDPSAVWYSLDNIEVPYFPQNLEVPEGGVKKEVAPPYVRSRSLR